MKTATFKNTKSHISIKIIKLGESYCVREEENKLGILGVDSDEVGGLCCCRN